MSGIEVPKGYKQTEVGVIPEDWGTPELGHIITSTQLGGNYSNNAYETAWPLIKMGNLGRGTIKLHKLEYVQRTSPPKDRDRLKNNDLLFNTRNTLELVGKIALWNNELPEAYFNSNIMRIHFDESKIASNRFMNYILNTKQFLIFLRGIAIGTTSVAAIYNRDLLKLTIPLPPTKAEQEAIAEALSDADGLIESLEQLIAKKRMIKQGAMQELLTGKKRLPGVSGEWEIKRLEDIAKIVMGQSPNSAHYNCNSNGLPLIQGNADISKRKTIKRVFTTEITKQGLVGDILMSVRAPVGEISRAMFNVCLGRGVCAIRYPSDFLYYVLVAKEPIWVKLSQGSTFDSINSTDVKNFNIKIPPTESEQTAIATILSDMDDEITALETKLTKARQIKQGMMQELLTGRVRLV